jgi:uncharacterized YigZ family protein
MKTISAIFTDTIEIKGSKFIAFLIPIASFESEMNQLRELHPKAVHFVSASRAVNEYDQIVESSSDDGEPKGTSGKPTLTVLEGHDLINVALITVRYFGGTKLGPGGLVRAYAQAANAAYAQAQILPYKKLLRESFFCDYSSVSKVEYAMENNNVGCYHKEFGLNGIEFGVEGTKEHLQQLYDVLGRSVIPCSTVSHPALTL